MVTPEAVCLYDSMIAGLHDLEKAGVNAITTITPAFTAALQRVDEEGSDALKRSMHKLKEEILLAPWNLTSNFLEAQKGKAQLEISGIGDPSRRGEAFSYVRESVKANPNIKRNKEEIITKNAVTGTDADLRKLSLEDSKNLLMKFGVSEAEITGLSRWGRIGLVRKLANDAAATGEGVTKFARGFRITVPQQQAARREVIQGIWDQQMAALANPDPDVSSDEEDEEDDLGLDFETMLTQGKKRRRWGKDEEELEEKMQLKKFHDDLKNGVTSSEKKNTNGPELKLPSFVEGTLDQPLPKSLRVKIKGKEMEIRDPVQIEKILLMKKNKEESRNLKRLKTMTAEEEEEMIQKKKEKRRLQEQLRRARNSLAKQQQQIERMKEGANVDLQVNAIRCGACNQPGHMRTNRTCPFFKEDTSEDEGKRRGKKRKDDGGFDLDEERDFILNQQMRNREGQRRRTRGSTGAQVQLSNLFEKIVDRVRDLPIAQNFKTRVSRKEAPDYYDVVAHPMDLSEIKRRAKDNHYHSREQFIADFTLMKENCHLYNTTRYPHLLPQVDTLYELAASFTMEHNDTLAKLEGEVMAENEGEVPMSPGAMSPPSQYSQWSPQSSPQQQWSHSPQGSPLQLDDYEEEIDIL